MAIDNQYDGEVVDGATKFQKREIVVSTQSSPTDKLKAHLEAAYRDTHQQVYQEVDRHVCRDMHREVYQEVLPARQKYAERQVYQVPSEATYRERNHEVDRMVTSADFQRQSPSQAASMSQCQIPMTVGCKICPTEHAEALQRAQRMLRCLNLVSITILEELTC